VTSTSPFLRYGRTRKRWCRSSTGAAPNAAAGNEVLSVDLPAPSGPAITITPPRRRPGGAALTPARPISTTSASQFPSAWSVHSARAATESRPGRHTPVALDRLDPVDPPKPITRHYAWTHVAPPHPHRMSWPRPGGLVHLRSTQETTVRWLAPRPGLVRRTRSVTAGAWTCGVSPRAGTLSSLTS
jgi:hypothetical protein